MSVAILGPGGKYRGALMMFMPVLDNPDFPTSSQSRELQISLKQANDPAVAVGAFNFAVGAWEDPAIGPIEWHSGIAARDALKSCLAVKK